MGSNTSKGSSYGEEVMNQKNMYSYHSGEQVGEEKKQVQGGLRYTAQKTGWVILLLTKIKNRKEEQVPWWWIGTGRHGEFETHGIQSIRSTGTETSEKKLRDVNLDPGEYETSEIIRASERVRKEDETLRARRRKNQKKSQPGVSKRKKNQGRKMRKKASKGF